MTASGALALLLHVPLMAAAALLAAGLSPWAAARLEGRAGPSPLQPWHDWRAQLRKPPVRPEGASRLFAAAPLVCLATTAVAALLVPSFSLGMATAPAADLVVVTGLLALSRCLLALAALDAGSAPGALAALGSLRTGLVAEPALLPLALTLAVLTGSTNLSVAGSALGETALPALPLLVVLCGLAGIATLDGPGDLPAFAGWQRVAAEASVALRRVVWLSLLAGLALPASLAAPGLDVAAWILAILAWSLKLAVLTAGCAAAASLAEREAGTIGISLLLVVAGLLFLLTGGDLA